MTLVDRRIIQIKTANEACSKEMLESMERDFYDGMTREEFLKSGRK